MRFLILAAFASIALSTTCNVANFGAVADGKTLNTLIVTQLLLNVSCSEVLVPQGGVYLVGAINLTRSDFTFRIDGILKASDDPSLFPVIPEVPSYPRSRDGGGPLRHNPVILLFNVSNVTVIGNGTIDGSGATWWKRYHDKTLINGRPRLFQTMYCSNIRLLYLKLLNSPFWTTHIWASEHIEVGWISVRAPRDQVNTDGLDPDSSSFVWGHDLDIHQGDDCVAVKSGLDASGRMFNTPSQNILIERLICFGNSVTIGSEVSGGVRNVTFRNVIMKPGASFGCEMKTSLNRGGYIRDIVFEDFEFEIVTEDGLSIRTDYEAPKNGTLPTPTLIENITYRNIKGLALWRAGSIACDMAIPCYNVALSHVQIDSVLGYKCGEGVRNSSSVDSKPELCKL